MIDVFFDLTKTVTWAFCRTLFKGSLHYHEERKKASRTMFNELYLISQVCRNNKLRFILLDSCPCSLNRAQLRDNTHTELKYQAQYSLCDSGVYLREILNAILFLVLHLIMLTYRSTAWEVMDCNKLKLNNDKTGAFIRTKSIHPL